ncbi:hypothetical protein [Streptomyces sp. MMG1121]|uniref:hypothetical protein n=1 Tax=Streptomyces sp. MMG1121 TaxID=1415544 RepID=UPI0006B020EA|nr:hypothetical protein [Streptomyces sp. MMG1121]KOV60416.1 hypothetical protein ADK64_29840 [Streptomyces sp. MMG1121]
MGPHVRRVRPGNRVAAALFPRWLDGPLESAHLSQPGGSLDGILTEQASAPGAVVVRVRAAGLDAADLQQARGDYPAPAGRPIAC